MRLEMLGEVIGPGEALIAHSAHVRPDAAVRPPVARQLVGPRERPRTARPRARERFLSGVAAHVRLEVRALAVHSTTQYRSLCCRSRTSHHNMTLPALLNCGTGGRYRSIAGTRRPQGSQQAANQPHAAAAVDRRDKQMDGQTDTQHPPTATQTLLGILFGQRQRYNTHNTRTVNRRTESEALAVAIEKGEMAGWV